MANERTYPILPCRDIDEALEFYAALGFKKTYRQLRPNPYAVVQREDLHLHFFGMPDFDPATSYGSVIVAVPDPDELYRSFAEGLRAAYKKLPNAGIPRILRPRKKFGTVYGFSVVDVGGNWLRVSKLGDTEEAEEPEEEKDLPHYTRLAARLGDAHGDEAKALKTLETGLKRFPDAPALERAEALLYHVDLAMRVNRPTDARQSLALVKALPLTAKQRKSLTEELAHAAELVAST